ncbi:hypothetical protein [Sphingobacterium detergens]|uniref:hypothetical protein n=1 Tax=Sphingobacterium detergens TaxID=1145106 RepID=UPI003AAD22CA
MEIIHNVYLSDLEKKDIQHHENTILIRALCGGSKIAFEKLYNRFWDRLYLASYNIIRDKQVCEDIVQEIFYQLWMRRSSLAIKNLETNLFTAVRFQVFRSINDKKCRNNFVMELSTLPADFFNLQRSNKEIEEALKSGIERLTENVVKYFTQAGRNI